MKDLSKYNVAFALCPELKLCISNEVSEYLVADTTNLQIASLLMFASRLDFVMQPDFSFKLNNNTVQVSFDYLIALHNSILFPHHKLVKKVKLQRHKRAKKLVAQSMMVRLV